MQDRTIILILLTPFALALIAGFAISRWRNPKLDRPLNLGKTWFRVLSSSFTVRQFIVTLIAIFPFALFSGIFPDFLVFPVILIVLGGLIYRFANQDSHLSEESKEILNALNEMTSKMSESGLFLEHLANLVRTKQLEIEQKEKIRTELENQIGEKSREKEAWDNLTAKQQDLVIQAIKKSQSRSIVLTMGVLIGSVVLNIVATVIWTLLGNPGRDELLKRFSEFSKLFNR